ncbi:MotA/TolQ/ExbB proton channel family protein [Rhodosalinus sediminis]|uniref:MotA/TolQ/ExbB proton channel family protein n=1 Tax=Rhodosalinus sediminis TaxID=1940533 RepID=UPI0023564473|nr:MotA/TolQ/ExbB proton channel family protein [Rhodosalinus sediminis]
MSSSLHGGSVAPPITVSALAGVSALYVLDYVWGGGNDAGARIFANNFCRVIMAAGLSAVIYSALEVRGLLHEGGWVFRNRWMIGRSGEAETWSHWDALRARRLAPLTYAVFALPLMGFLGTVVGISGAIGELGAVVASDDRSAALARVLADLKFAFDTTLVGLAGVLPTALGMTIVSAVGDRVEADLKAKPGARPA